MTPISLLTVEYNPFPHLLLSPSSNKNSDLIKIHKLVDRGKIVGMTFMMLGVSILIPWAVFSTATDFYVNFKLKWIAVDLIKEVDLLERLEEYQGFFINYLGIVFQVPNTLVGC